MKKKLYSLFTLSLLSLLTYVGTTQPYVFKVDVWSDGKQNVYCLSDGHYPTHLSIDQTKQFTDFVKEKNGSVIVEDILDYNGSSAETKRALTDFSQPELHFLPGLTAICKQNRIPVENIEFRQLSYASRKGYTVGAQEVLNRSEQTKKDASRYHDSNPFDSCSHDYFKKIESVQNQCEPYIKQLRNSTEPLQTLIPKTDYPETLDSLIGQFRGTLQTDLNLKKRDVIKVYDAALVDVRILHELAQNTNKNVFICAGGWHIDQLESSFNTLGYTKLHSVEGTQPIESKPQFPYGVSIKAAFKELDKSVTNNAINNASTVPQQSNYLPLLLLIGLALGAVIISYRKRRLALLIVFALLSGITNIVKPYVYQVDTWSNGKQNLYCLSDCHLAEPTYVEQQRTDLLNEAKNLDACVIVEDLCDYHRTNPQVQSWVSAVTGKTNQLLLSLASACRQQNIEAENVEFRQETSLSVDGWPIGTKEALDVSETIEQEVENYKDGSAYNEFYKAYCNQQNNLLVSAVKEWCAPLRSSDLCLKEVFKLPPPNKLKEFIKSAKLEGLSEQQQKEWILNLFNAHLLDCRIVHAIATHPQHPHLIIAAGGDHIENIKGALKHVGFKQVDSVKGTLSLQEENVPDMVDLKKAFNTIQHNLSHDRKKESSSSQNNLLPLLLILLLPLGAVILGYRKRKLALLIPFALLSLVNTVTPYVYQVDVWSNGKQNLYCLSDEHYPAQASVHQKERLLKQAKATNAAVIVEDMLTYEGNDPEIDKLIEAYHDGPYHFLLNLTQECQEHNVPVTNVEFRHASNASLAGLNKTAKEVFDLDERVKQEVKNYADGPAFKKCYQEYLDELEQLQDSCEPFIKQLRNKEQKLYNLLPNTRYHRSLDKLLEDDIGYLAPTKDERKNDLITMYDAALIDMRILHGIAQHPDKPLFICAGGWHIQHLEDAFKNLGYRCVQSTMGTVDVEGTQEDCLPKAVVLDEFFKTTPTEQPLQTKDTTHTGAILLFLILALFIFIMRSRIQVLKRRASLLLLLGLPALVDAHIYRIEKWTDETEKHNIFTFHDFHSSRFPNNQKTQQQRADIVKTGQKRDAGVIVEDMYLDLDKLVKNPVAYDPHSVKTLRDKELPSNKTTPLIALTPACKDGSLPVVNVEFRHTGLLSYAGKAGISAHDCLRATERARKKVAHFDDNSILNDFYKAILERHAQLLDEGKPFFDQIRSAGDATVEDLFENNKIAYSPAIDAALKTFGWTERRLESAPVKQKIEALFHYYDVGLVDAHIAHALHTYKDKANTFVCAGFKHIENIEDLLNNLGYNKVDHEGKGLLEGNNTMEPDALDIAEAMKRLDPHPIREASSSNLLILLVVTAIMLGLAVRNRKRQRKIIK